MKKLLLTLILLLSLTLLFSCKIGDDSGDNGSGDGTSGDTGGGTGNGSGGDTGSDDRNEILVYGSEVTIVTDGSVDSALLQRLSAAVERVTGKRPAYKSAQDEKAKTEIVIGSLERTVSTEAKAAVDKAYRRAVRRSQDYESSEKDIAVYGVYTDGSSIALAYTSDYFIESAVDYFIDNYLSSDSLSLYPGYIKTNVASKTEYLVERGERIKAEAWEVLASKLPAEYSKEIVSALKGYYTLFNADVVDWLANLYDPGTGGFYYSNSARDNEPYLPDIESTVEALEFIGSSGMAEMYGGSWVAATPEWLHEQVGNWVYNLQDEDGFFYHEQWSKSYIEENGRQTRITRDQGSAQRILEPLGITPQYAIKGASYSGNLTPSLSGDKVVAVSKVVAASSTLDKFASVANFKKYLAEMEASLVGLTDKQFAYQFYVWGNEFQTAYKYLNAEMAKLLIDFFNKYQNPKTGLWSEELSYTSTDGMHKLGAVYNAIGSKFGEGSQKIDTAFKYTDQMIDSALKVLTDTSMQAEAAVDMYNAISGFYYVYSSVNRSTLTSEQKQEKIEGYKAKVFENMPAMIRNATKQYMGFAFSDGSFGYNLAKVGQGGTAQGCPVAIPGTKEGDVNGTSTCIIAVISYFLEAMEVDERYMVPMFTEAERYRFVSTLEELGAVLKNEAQVVDPFAYDFEESASEYDIPIDLNMSQRNSEVIIEKDENGNSRLAITSYPWYQLEGYGTEKRNGNFTIRPVSVSKKDTVGVVEFDIAFDGVTKETDGSFMIHYSTNTANFATFYVKLQKEGRFYYAYFLDNAREDLGIRLPVGDVTMTLRIEYYRAESAFKLYVNGDFLTETSAMNGQGGAFDRVLFEFNASAQMKVYFDNITVQKEYIKYEKPTDGKAPTFEEPVLGRPVYDFEATTSNKDYPRGLEVLENSGKVDIVGSVGKRKLEISGSRFAGHKNPELAFYCYNPDGDANAYVFAADIVATYNADWAIWKNLANLTFLDIDGNAVISLMLRAKRVGNSTQLCITDKSNLSSPLITFGSDTSFNLRAVYFPENSEIFVYANETFVTSYKNSSATGEIDKMKISIETGVGIKLTVDNLALTGESIDYYALKEWPNVADGLGKPAPEFPWISGDSNVPDSGDTSEDMELGGFTPTDKPTEKVEPIEPAPPTEPDDGGDEGGSGGDSGGTGDGDDEGGSGGDSGGTGDGDDEGGSGDGSDNVGDGESTGGGYHPGAWS